MGKSASLIGGVAGGIGGAFLGGPAGAMAGYQLGSGLGSAVGGGGGGQVGGYYGGAQGDLQAAGRMAQFTPVGISNRFGSSSFGYDPSGRLSSASYALTPEAKSLQDYAMSQATAGQADTSRLLSLGRDYIAASPEEAAQQYMLSRRGLLQPGLDTQYNQIKSGLLQTGRGGLAIGQGGQLAAANPELQAYYNAAALQEARLAAEADQEGFNRVARGQGLLSSAYTPISTPLALSGTIDEMGRGSLDIGSALGSRSMTGAANASKLYGDASMAGLAGNIAQGGINASRQTSLMNTLGGVFSNPQIGNWFSGLIGSSGGSGGGFGLGQGAGSGGVFGVSGGGFGGGYMTNSNPGGYGIRY
jgi:hypothetical protein